MADAVVALVAAVIGGGLTLVGTFLLEARRERVHDRQRWDERRLDALVELCGSAQLYEGAHYRRGRALYDRDEFLTDRVESASTASTMLWSAAIAAELHLPELRNAIAELRLTARSLRDVADEGLATRQPSWIEARDRHQRAIQSLQDDAARVLGLGYGGAASESLEAPNAA
jgi:hypothetical protein